MAVGSDSEFQVQEHRCLHFWSSAEPRVLLTSISLHVLYNYSYKTSTDGIFAMDIPKAQNGPKALIMWSLGPKALRYESSEPMGMMLMEMTSAPHLRQILAFRGDFLRGEDQARLALDLGRIEVL